MTIKETAEKWNISVRRVQTICNEGMVPGVMKFGHAWAIPKDAEKPIDKRVKSGKHVKRQNVRELKKRDAEKKIDKEKNKKFVL